MLKIISQCRNEKWPSAKISAAGRNESEINEAERNEVIDMKWRKPSAKRRRKKRRSIKYQRKQKKKKRNERENHEERKAAGESSSGVISVSQRRS